MYAKTQYNEDEEKKEFFNKFINRVILYDNRLIILYNTSPDSQTEIKIGEQKGQLLVNDIVDNKKCNSFDKEFKRVARGGGEGIRTPVNFRSNSFQDYPVMTASVRLRAS